MTRKLILDLDTGIDDTLAIAYALASEQADDVRLIGITGTYGNVTVETGMRNTLAVTDLLGHPEVSVYPVSTARRPHRKTSRYSPSAGTRRIHGDNGIGDMTIPRFAALAGNDGCGGFHHRRGAHVRQGLGHRAHRRDDHDRRSLPS